MPDSSAALVKQLKTDAGPHASPDQVRAAQKRRAAALAAEGRTSEPEERHAPEAQTTARKAKKK